MKPENDQQNIQTKPIITIGIEWEKYYLDIKLKKDEKAKEIEESKENKNSQKPKWSELLSGYLPELKKDKKIE